MLRHGSLRFAFAMLTLLAASMDTATKVLHGIVHEREAQAHLHGVPCGARAPGGSETNGRSATLEAADDDEHGHAVLHGAASTRMLKIPLATRASAPLPATLRGTGTGVPAVLPKDELPATDRAGPRRSRAPPIA